MGQAQVRILATSRFYFIDIPARQLTVHQVNIFLQYLEAFKCLDFLSDLPLIGRSSELTNYTFVTII